MLVQRAPMRSDITGGVGACAVTVCQLQVCCTFFVLSCHISTNMIRGMRVVLSHGHLRHVGSMVHCDDDSRVLLHGVHHQAIAVCAVLVPADIQNMIRSMWSCEAPCKEDPPLGPPVREISPGRGLGIVSAAPPGNAPDDGTRADKRSKAGAMKVPALIPWLLAMCQYQSHEFVASTLSCDEMHETNHSCCPHLGKTPWHAALIMCSCA